MFFLHKHTQTEQIRRVNRLFASDSLFLRQYLMVPVDRDTSLQHNQFTKQMSLPAASTTATALTPTDEFLSDFCGSSSQFAASMMPPTSTNVPNSSSSPVANENTDDILSPEEESKKSIEDFLGKIDSNLAKTKKYVKNRYAVCCHEHIDATLQFVL